MSILPDSDFLVAKTKYLQARSLMLKSNPETEPYKSCYQARELLYELEEWLGDKDVTIVAVVRALIGEISGHTQEFETAKRYLKMSRKALKQLQPRKENILCSIFTLNQLGLLFSTIDKPEKTLKYLKQAEALYYEWKAHGSGECASIEELFGCEANGKGSEELECQHTLTLYYMAQACTFSFQPNLAARYCHCTLARQLETIATQNKIEWGLNAAALSQVFLEHYMFKEACHHLCAANYVLDLHRGNLESSPAEGEQHEADLEELKRADSDVALCWLKYDIMLLSVSKERLVNEDEEAQKYCQYPDELIGLLFPNLNLNCYKRDEIINFALMYEDAKPIFLHGQECAKKGKEYFTLNENASDYIKIQQDLSRLYCGLQFFEDDESRSCKMWKRRADILTEIIQEVNPVHYLTPCREIWFELGEIYTSMHDTKSKQISDDVTGHVTEKCSKLLLQAIGSYQSFIDSFKDFKTGTIPDLVEHENERGLLLAHIYIARLSTKLIGTKYVHGKNIQLKNLKYYQFVVDYCNKRKEKLGTNAPKILLNSELSLCEEMVKLLPLAVMKLGIKQLQSVN